LLFCWPFLATSAGGASPGNRDHFLRGIQHPERAKREPTEGVGRLKDGASDVVDKVSDTAEDMIPGDSDRDGH
jgi:hypothetical protein